MASSVDNKTVVSEEPPKVKGREGIPKFQKDKFKAVVDVKMILSEMKNGTIHHDFEPVVDFGRTLASVTYPCHTKQYGAEAETREVWGTTVHRLTSAVMAKKLAHSLTPSDMLENVRSASVMQKAQLYAPTALMPVFNMYGNIRTPSGGYNVSGQPFLTLTYCMRAVHPDRNVNLGVNLEIDRYNDIFINTQSPTTTEHCIKWLVGFINSWAQVAGGMELAIGANVARFKVPLIVSGAVAYAAMTAPVQKPPEILRALERLAFLEQQGNNLWNGERIVAAAALGIQIVSFGGTEFSRAMQAYGEEVQDVVYNSLFPYYQMGFVTGCDSTGTLGQVIRRVGDESGYAPEKVDDKDIEIGWMMSGTRSFASMEPERYVVSSTKSAQEKMRNYLIGMRRDKT